jgi:hypothetical protein
MSKYVRRAALVAFAATLNAAHSAPAPVDAYARRPAMIDVDLNPAGTRLAFVEDVGTNTRVVIHDLVAKKDIRTLNSPKSLTLHKVLWANDETLLIQKSTTESLTLSSGGRDVFQNVDTWVWSASSPTTPPYSRPVSCAAIRARKSWRFPSMDRRCAWSPSTPSSKSRG